MRLRTNRILRPSLALAAVGLALAIGLQPASAEKKDDGDDRINVKTTSTVNIMPTGAPGTARYSGRLTCKPKPKGPRDERAERRRLAKRCLSGRGVSVHHGSFFVGGAETDSDGDWEVVGNKPPPGDSVEILVIAAPSLQEEDAGQFKGVYCRVFRTSKVVPF